MIYFDEEHNAYGDTLSIDGKNIVYSCENEIWDDFNRNPDKYVWESNEIVINPDYEEIVANADVEVNNLGGYVYAQGFSPDGDKLVKLVFDCSDDSTLKTIRLEGNGTTAWFKDGAIFDQDGNAISGDTPLAGLSIIIDMEASGLDVNGWNHMHAGDFDGTL